MCENKVFQKKKYSSHIPLTHREKYTQTRF